MIEIEGFEVVLCGSQPWVFNKTLFGNNLLAPTRIYGGLRTSQYLPTFSVTTCFPARAASTEALEERSFN